ncbi:hypothetical protein [Deinococcus hopiensis]|uniref:hypothetical protein n=1 Tax=Deinococcus hopiensis TaxID=309885 RepID=UPI00111C30FD|nr:hypothetical protein [Deinococcus hopiensis]
MVRPGSWAGDDAWLGPAQALREAEFGEPRLHHAEWRTRVEGWNELAAALLLHARRIPLPDAANLARGRQGPGAA